MCEDAATFKQTSGTSYVIGGGAFKADDKIFQFNGRGTLEINGFYAQDYGKVVRNCGNCSGNGGPRNVVLKNVIARDGGVLCGINTNYRGELPCVPSLPRGWSLLAELEVRVLTLRKDTCRISNSCQDSGKYCDRYTGNSNGNEPVKIGSGPDGTYCTTSSDVSDDC